MSDFDPIKEYFKFIKSTSELLRSYNVRGMILFYLLGLSLFGNRFSIIQILIVTTIFICVYAEASIFNYFDDYKIDKKNKRTNPLNLVTTNQKYLLPFLSAATAYILAFFTNNVLITSIWITFLLILGHQYSNPPLRLSHNPVGKIVSMVLVYTLIPGLAGMNFNINHSQILILLTYVLFYSSWLLYSDVKDIKGDSYYGKITLAVLLGVRKLSFLSFFLSLTSVISLFYLSMFLQIGKELILFMLLLTSLQFAAWLNPKIIENRLLKTLSGYLLLAYFIFTVIRFQVYVK